MATIISGTNGVVVPDGSAGTPAIQGQDTNTGIFFPAADTIAFAEGGAEAMRIDSSGNVGIGNSSPAARLDLQGSVGTSTPLLILRNASAANASNIVQAQFFAGNTFGGLEQIASIAALNPNAGANNGGALVLSTSANGTATTPAERMRLDSSGNVGIGETAPASYGKLTVTGSSGADGINAWVRNTSDTSGDNVKYAGIQFSIGSDNGSAAIRAYRTNSSNNFETALAFFTKNNTAGATTPTERMRIDSSGGLILVGSTAQKATGTTWSNPSDRRLKDNIRDYGKGLAELMQVRVREWEYNGKGGTVEGTKGLGVVADEVITVLPDTVENYDAKLNADDEEATAIKKFDATEITWLLVKTVQEQQALITSLTARITALEGAN